MRCWPLSNRRKLAAWTGRSSDRSMLGNQLPDTAVSAQWHPLGPKCEKLDWNQHAGQAVVAFTGLSKLTKTRYVMHLKTAGNWLNMLLVLLLVAGSWPISAMAGSGCPQAALSAPPAHHEDCKTGGDQQQHPSLSDHCCPISICSALVFLPSSGNIFLTKHRPAAVSSPDDNYRFNGSAPPTPPPITYSMV